MKQNSYQLVKLLSMAQFCNQQLTVQNDASCTNSYWPTDKHVLSQKMLQLAHKISETLVSTATSFPVPSIYAPAGESPMIFTIFLSTWLCSISKCFARTLRCECKIEVDRNFRLRRVGKRATANWHVNILLLWVRNCAKHGSFSSQGQPAAWCSTKVQQCLSCSPTLFCEWCSLPCPAHIPKQCHWQARTAPHLRVAKWTFYWTQVDAEQKGNNGSNVHWQNAPRCFTHRI